MSTSFPSRERLKTPSFFDNLIKNIKISRGDESPIQALDVSGKFAVTVGTFGSIHLWDLEKGECRWRFGSTHLLKWRGKVKIVDGRVIYSYQKTSENFFERWGTIRVHDLQKGTELVTFSDSRIIAESVNAVSQSIFSLLDNGNIGKWTFDGVFIQEILSSNSPHFSQKLLNSNEILIHLFENILRIYNTRINCQKVVELKGEILETHIDGYHLICCCKGDEKSSFHCSIIDLKKGISLKDYHLKISEDKCGEVQKIIGTQSEIYLGFSSGMVIAIDLTKDSHHYFKHPFPLSQLALNGKILIGVGEEVPTKISATMKFWNTHTKQELTEIKLPAPLQIQFTANKIVCTTRSAIFSKNVD